MSLVFYYYQKSPIPCFPQSSESYLKVNPLGQVPSLQVDGTSLTQSVSVKCWKETGLNSLIMKWENNDPIRTNWQLCLFFHFFILSKYGKPDISQLRRKCIFFCNVNFWLLYYCCIIFHQVSIFEYLEEKYPEKPLLPKDLLDRAKVRLLSIIL